MSSQVYYRKWRPQTLAEVVGQERVTQTLKNALTSGRVAHAYLFCGPRGTGKTSTGRILAKAVNCLEGGRGEPCNQCRECQAATEGRALDLIEIDAASNRGIDEIRDLREKVAFAPNTARYKVYIIDEVHMLTEPAFNALLKTLEEPPPHAIFVLATTEVHKVPLTILSRCQRFDFRRIPLAAVVSRLEDLCRKEEIEVEPQALALIARSASGSLRDAENLMEQLVIYHGPRIDLRQVEAELGITGDARIRELARQVLQGDVGRGLATINSVSHDGLDLRQFNRELVECLRKALLIKAGARDTVDLSREEADRLAELSDGTSVGHISKAIRHFSQIDLRFDPQATLPLELALVECALSFGKRAPESAKEEVPRPPAPAAVEEEAHAEPVARPAPAPEPVPEPAPALALEGTGDIEQIKRHWRDFVNACRGAGSSGNLDALLRGFCQPVTLEGQTLTLGFTADFHKQKIEDPKYRHLVEQKLAEVFSTSYRVRCVRIERDKRAPAPPRGPSPLVQEALKMGARILDEESNGHDE